MTAVVANLKASLVVADCGAGLRVIGGGGDCTGKAAPLKGACPCASASCTTCVTGSTPTRYWLVKCSAADLDNRAYAFCIQN